MRRSSRMRMKKRREERLDEVCRATDDDLVRRYKHCLGSEEKRSRKLNMSCLGDECSSC